MSIEQDVRERHFVEQLAMVFESSGLPPMYGRVLARLLICDPPHQSLTELTDYLSASKGAISIATRALMQMGLVERTAVAGSRGSWFRIKKNAFTEVMKADIVRLGILRKLADEGLDVLKNEPPERTERLREFRDLYGYFEQVFPQLIDTWIKEREK